MPEKAAEVPAAASPSGPLAGLLVADFSRILAGPYATMLLADLGAEVVKVEGPAATTPAPGSRRSRDGVSTYYLGVNRNKRSIALDLKDPDDLAGRAGAGPARRRRDRELQARRPGAVRPGLRRRCAARNPASSTPRSAASAAAPRARSLPGYDLMVQAISGPDEPHRRPGRPAVPRRHLGLRRDGRAARDDRRPRRAAAPRTRPGAGSTSRSTCCPRALSGLVNQTSAVRRRRRRAVPDGQRHPSLFPYEPLPLRRRRPDHHRRQRRPVPQARRGARRPGAGRRPALRPQRGPHRQPRAAAAAAGRARSPPATRDGVVRATSSPPACRAGRSTPSTAASRSPRTSASTRWSRSGEGDGGAVGAQPDPRFSATPPATGCRRPALDEHGARDPRLAATAGADHG